MSLECSECERDLRGGHGPGCSRFVDWLKREADKADKSGAREAASVIMEAASHIEEFNCVYDRLFDRAQRKDTAIKAALDRIKTEHHHDPFLTDLLTDAVLQRQ